MEVNKVCCGHMENDPIVMQLKLVNLYMWAVSHTSFSQVVSIVRVFSLWFVQNLAVHTFRSTDTQ